MDAYFCPAPVEGFSLGLPAAPTFPWCQCKPRSVRSSSGGSCVGRREEKKADAAVREVRACVDSGRFPAVML